MPKAPRPVLRWWAQRWVDMLESLGPEYAGRLQRARSYDRNGHVWQTHVRAGRISAQVLGSYGYYSTAIKVPIFPDGVWQRALDALAERPTLLASILADDMPPEFDMILNEAGGTLFLDDPELLTFSCSCPDWERPCKHALALAYDFTMQIDVHPGLLLTLYGRTVDDLMAAIRASWADKQDAQEAAAPKPSHAMRIEGFYSAGEALDRLSIPMDVPQVNGALLLRLGKPPFARDDEDPLPALSAYYAAMTEQAARVLAKTRNAPTVSLGGMAQENAAEPSEE